MSTLSTILAVFLGVFFVGVGIPKLTGQADVVANFKRWGYADTIRIATGIVEVLAGVLLLVGIGVQAVAITGALLVMFVMLGALMTHSRVRDPFTKWAPPVLLLALAFALAYSMLP